MRPSLCSSLSLAVVVAVALAVLSVLPSHKCPQVVALAFLSVIPEGNLLFPGDPTQALERNIVIRNLRGMRVIIPARGPLVKAGRVPAAALLISAAAAAILAAP